MAIVGVLFLRFFAVAFFWSFGAGPLLRLKWRRDGFLGEGVLVEGDVGALRFLEGDILEDRAVLADDDITRNEGKSWE